ncbi:hypothetical protein IRT45_35450 [Nocardia sp. BSTN01]|uniref:hypothetical protein n=1 Tax=Nocardia sp. BSTN01 TaxID=2783665 RepID=UPI00189034C2|nr:hypothetical protein [Nocardia sp. BSTN01]MBF5002415.1 hypothetical protein [Nocardia sp. BSTN01]
MSSDADEFLPRYMVRGVGEVDPGKLWQITGGRWAEARPIECRNGHNLLADRSVIVGSQACAAAPNRSHRTHACAECGDVIYTPPPGPDCHHTAFDSRPTR